MRDKVGRADVGIGLYESVTRSADGRADVGIGPYGGGYKLSLIHI